MSDDEKEDGSLTLEERTYAKQVILLREERGLSQNDLALLLQERGISYASQSMISRIEKLRRPVRMIEAQAFSAVFDRTIATMMHPDERELDLIAYRAFLDRAFAMYRDWIRATREVAKEISTQTDALIEVEGKYGDGESFDPELRDRYQRLLDGLNTFSSKWLADDAERYQRDAMTVQHSADGSDVP